MPTKAIDPIVRFQKFLMPEPNTGCTIFIGHLDHDGYGGFRDSPISTCRAHNFAWITEVGPIPNGKLLDHVCRLRCCVNVRHLRPVTNKENILCGESPHAINARKTHCNNGHPLDGENLYLRKDFYARVCKTCVRAAKARYRKKNK